MGGQFGVAVFAAIYLVAMPTTAVGQALTSGYAFVSPTAVSAIGSRSFAWSAGGGAEIGVGGATSIGVEVGYLNFPSVETHNARYSASMPSAEAVLLSANGYRHWGTANGGSKWRPFITGGISFLLAPEPIGMFNLGGGVDRWMTAHVGLHFELRDHLFVGTEGAGSVLLGFRAGVVFR